MEVRFNNVSIDVKAPGGTMKRILEGASGVARPGELVALLGPSGAGKTTLLSALAGRTTLASGTITMDGVERQKGAAKSGSKQSVAFVTQDDTLFTGLTVFETLWYTAALRLPHDTTQQERLERVRSVIKRLGLAKVAHTKVGTVLSRGLSGGERKRLNVASEMLTEPPVLLADEPTSGLDHVAALALVDVFADIAATGKTIIATVHQPSSTLFRRFTTCCVLAEGRVVFAGPAAAVAAYLEAPPIVQVCPEHHNIADHILEVVNALDPADLAVAWGEAPKDDNGMLRLPDALSEDHEADAAPGATPSAEADADGLGDKAATVSGSKSALSAPGAGAAVQRDSKADAGETDAEPGAVSVIVEAEAESEPVSETGAASADSARVRAIASGAKLLKSAASSAAVVAAETALDDARPVSAEPPACLRGCCMDRRWPTSWWQQFFALSSRAFKTSSGSTLTTLMTIQHLCICLVGSAIWWRLRRSAGSIQDRLGLEFFYIIYTGFTAMFGALTTFPSERAVLRRERSSGAFRLSAYYAAKCVADIPISCVYPLMVGTVVYWTTGLREDAGAYLSWLGILLLTAQVAQAVGVLISAAVLDFQRSIVIASVLMLGFMLTSGFYSTEIPPALGWIKFLGFPSYAYQLAIFNEFVPTELFSCLPGEGFAGLPCPVAGVDVQASIIPPVPESGHAIAVLVAMYVVYRFLGYVALRINA